MERKSKISLVSIAAVLVLVIALTCVFAACGHKPDATTTTPEATSFVNIDINPSLELVLDQNNKVIDVKAENADAEVLIHGEDGILNVDLNVAVKNIGSLAVELGYINDDNKSINVSVASTNDVDAQAIYNSVKTNITSSVGEIACVVEQNIDVVYAKELEAIKEKYQKNEKVQALDVPRYRLVRSAMMYNFGLTFTEACEKSNAELASLVKDSKTNIKSNIDRHYEDAVKTAQTAYENAKSVSKDFAYFTVLDTTDILQGDALAATNYLASHINELCLKQAYDVYKMLIFDTEYNKITVEAIANTLFANDQATKDKFMDEAAVLKDGKTVYTKQSIMQFVNKEFRNMTADARDEFNTKYNEAAVTIEAEMKKTHDIEASINVDDFTASFSGTFQLSEATQKSITSAITGIQNIINDGFSGILGFNKKSEEEKFEKKIEKAEAKTLETKEKIESKLDNDALDKVQKQQAKYDEAMTTLETQFAEATKAFTKEANTWIEQTKAAKKQAQAA